MSKHFEHTIGSHSDDRGGDSDNPCYCPTDDPKPTPTPTPTNKNIEEILADITFHPSDIDMDKERREYATQALNQLMLKECLDELDEILKMCLSNYEATKNYDMKVLANYCENRIAQLESEK